MKKQITAVCAAAVMAGMMVSAGAANTVTATPTEWKGQTVQMDGQIVKIEGYNIKDNNYFKLRDLGKLLDFEVSFDAASNTVTIGDLSTSYTMLPDEAPIRTWDDGLGLVNYIGTGVSGQTQQQAKLTTQRFTANGKPVSLTAYQIAGNNYLMLRDVAALTGFDVDYIPDGRVVRISVEEQADKPQEPGANSGDSANSNTGNAEDSSSSTTVTDEMLRTWELQMVDLVNEERRKAGVSPLIRDEMCMEFAQFWAQHLATVKFEHSTIADMYAWVKGVSVEDVLEPDGSFFMTEEMSKEIDRFAGLENITGAGRMTELGVEMGFDPMKSAMNNFMNSEGHRNSILNKDMTHVGIGFALAEDGNIYCCQTFA